MLWARHRHSQNTCRRNRKLASLFLAFVVCGMMYVKLIHKDDLFPDNAPSPPVLPYFHLEVPYFEPEAKDDFPTSTSAPRIPHIIHQTYKSEDIANDFVKNVQSFLHFNRNWTYMFWTDATARQLIEARYPDFLVLWDNYRNNINKADALGYFVLYEFGGIYADLDFECFRPLDPVTRKYAAIFPLEPFEHSTFRLKIPFLLNNAIMMTRPRHPFLKFMIDNLMAFQMQMEQFDVAGPCFVTTNFVLYNKLKVDDLYNLSATPDGMSPYFYKGSMDETDENAVFLRSYMVFVFIKGNSCTAKFQLTIKYLAT
ncbi:uncharacterized protein LOC127859816 [Dreissena polymorpha]|uniref:uncharacterized protein LOC127859816 n=1 Tax=Dreissena polymorpha TaxID=45954 RepID=UPI0022644F80|nr:uncharacterized protein LOC127859816 [Dreissena polymorpha]